MNIVRLSCFYAANQVDALLRDHWEEVAKNKDLMALAPDWDRYAMLENSGNLFTLFALEGSRVVGYSCNVIDKHMHYKELTIASNDVLFVAPDQRGTVGLRLINETEKHAKQQGAQLMLWHAKQDSQLDKLLKAKAKRYSVQDIIYSTPL